MATLKEWLLCLQALSVPACSGAKPPIFSFCFTSHTTWFTSSWHTSHIQVQLNVIICCIKYEHHLLNQVVVGRVFLVWDGRCVDFLLSWCQWELIPLFRSQAGKQSGFCWVATFQWGSSKPIGRCRAQWQAWGVRLNHVLDVTQLVSWTDTGSHQTQASLFDSTFTSCAVRLCNKSCQFLHLSHCYLFFVER